MAKKAKKDNAVQKLFGVYFAGIQILITEIPELYAKMEKILSGAIELAKTDANAAKEYTDNEMKALVAEYRMN